MQTVTLGRTNLTVNKDGFGALPIQRISFEETKNILQKAIAGGINFIDTARMYSNSEEKIGASLSPAQRKNIIIATKAKICSAKDLTTSIQTSLKNLQTDYIDIMQVHLANRVPKAEDEDGYYQALLQAKQEGKIRFIGLTAHSIDVAIAAAKSGLYDTIQFPLSYISTGKDLDLPIICRENNIGFLAMKALGGGLITNIPAAYAFMHRYDNVLPLWGIQKMSELEEFLALAASPPKWNEAMEQSIKADCAELGASFCRGCGYCTPCPVGIEINFVARVKLLLGRAPLQNVVNEAGKAKLALAENCIQCGECNKKCPYELDTQELVRSNLEFYKKFILEHNI